MWVDGKVIVKQAEAEADSSLLLGRAKACCAEAIQIFSVLCELKEEECKVQSEWYKYPTMNSSVMIRRYYIVMIHPSLLFVHQ